MIALYRKSLPFRTMLDFPWILHVHEAWFLDVLESGWNWARAFLSLCDTVKEYNKQTRSWCDHVSFHPPQLNISYTWIMSFYTDFYLPHVCMLHIKPACTAIDVFISLCLGVCGEYILHDGLCLICYTSPEFCQTELLESLNGPVYLLSTFRIGCPSSGFRLLFKPRTWFCGFRQISVRLVSVCSIDAAIICPLSWVSHRHIAESTYSPIFTAE